MPVFTANIPGILKIGDRIEIGGRIKENARKMSVNLCAQEGEEPRDVVLHFDVRFHRDNIISLSRRNGVWIGSGNLDTNYNMFVPGTVFRIIFEVKDTDVITIYCQGKFHSNFLPKIPLTMARYLVAWADVERVTHCYFHMSGKGVGDEATVPPAVKPSQSPRLGAAPVFMGESNRCSRIHKNLSPVPPQFHSSNESSDEDMKSRKEGRADKYFYDALMCQPPETKFGSPEVKYREVRSKPEYSRKYKDNSDTEKDTDISEEVASKNIDSSVAESQDFMPELDFKKRINRRGKFAPFAQVVNFMGKNARRN